MICSSHSRTYPTIVPTVPSNAHLNGNGLLGWVCDDGYTPEVIKFEWICIKSTVVTDANERDDEPDIEVTPVHDIEANPVCETGYQATLNAYNKLECTFIRDEQHHPIHYMEITDTITDIETMASTNCKQTNETLKMTSTYSHNIVYAICKNNMLDSIKIYYPNGNIKLALPFEKGKLHGIGKDYYPNGNIETVRSFKLGNYNGEYIEYDSLGSMTNKWIYVNDVLKTSYGFYPNGSVSRKSSYVNDKIHGVQYRFYPSGSIQWKIPYVNGNIGYGVVSYYGDNSPDIITKYRSKMTNGLCYTYQKIEINPNVTDILNGIIPKNEISVAKRFAKWRLIYEGTPADDITKCTDYYKSN